MRFGSIAAGLCALIPLAACGAAGGNSSTTTATSTPPASTASQGSAASSGRSPPASAAAGDNWLTYHRDNARTGFDPTGPRIGHPRHAWTSPALDGQIYGEPLIAGDRVIVATENDTFYALARASGRVLWHSHVGTPVSGGSLPCGNIDPSGITGTPVIDRAAGIAYAVAFDASGPHHALVGVSLTSGHVLVRRSIDAPGADPSTHQERAALSLSQGRVIVEYGGLYGDCGTYHGQVLSAPAGSSQGAVASFQVPSGNEAGIWTPSGAAIDSSGHVYVATGNGSSSSSFDFGNAVIRLSPTLHREGFFAPTDFAQLNSSDNDLGSVGPLLLGDGRVFEIGKPGVGYLLDSSHLGNLGGQLGSLQVCPSSSDAAFGGLALAGGLIIVPCSDGLRSVRPGGGGRMSPRWSTSRSTGPPIVAAGAVWAIDVNAGQLLALSLHTGHELFSAGIGSPAHFSTPAASAGMIFAAGGRAVVAFRVR
jgi:outer membrane protein assembly factor BamB